MTAPAHPPLRYAVLASGGGSNFQALLDRSDSGDLPAQAVFVASNNSKSGALEKATTAGVPAYHVSSVSLESAKMLKQTLADAPVTPIRPSEWESAALLLLLEEHEPDLLVLAGYMKKVPDAVLERMKNRVVNIHPALLPKYGGAGMYGHHVHEAVVKAGEPFGGMTIHMVNEHYDEGQIVAQRRVGVEGADAAEAARRVLALEHDTYWRVLKGFADGDIVPTGSDDPARAVEISPRWRDAMRALPGTVFP